MSKQINFTIVPEDPEDPARARREYANFCAVAHTPFDLTLTFCDVRPLSSRDIEQAEASQTVRAPVVARIALPFSVVAGLVSALQEQMRAVQEAQAAPSPEGWPKGPLH
ncbi:MAG TPA: DUF3467 domain-containing protein [Vicinamibacterales bacterium]|jgi:hypothetical protein|nr:DUF3467 domain-containing protein [Vicinamibacterales bacterium]